MPLFISNYIAFLKSVLPDINITTSLFFQLISVSLHQMNDIMLYDVSISNGIYFFVHLTYACMYI